MGNGMPLTAPVTPLPPSVSLAVAAMVGQSARKGTGVRQVARALARRDDGGAWTSEVVYEAPSTRTWSNTCWDTRVPMARSPVPSNGTLVETRRSPKKMVTVSTPATCLIRSTRAFPAAISTPASAP